MKAIKTELAGREQYLCFTVEAMFQIEERFGGSSKLMETITAGGRDGHAAVCGAAAILAEQGELARRGLGYDPASVVEEKTITGWPMAPSGLAELTAAIVHSIALGYGREVEPEDDVIDLYMVELEAQKKTR